MDETPHLPYSGTQPSLEIPWLAGAELSDFSMTQDGERIQGWWSGSVANGKMIRRAFPNLGFSLTKMTSGASDRYCIELNGEEGDIKALEEFLRFLSRHVLLNSDLDECFALDFHKYITAEGEVLRTPMGQLVVTAKPYAPHASPGHLRRADILAIQMANFIHCHPSYRRAELLVAAPASDPSKPFHLPDYLVSSIAKQTGQVALSRGAIWKTQTTLQMKSVQSVKEKLSTIRGTIAVDPSQVAGKTIVVIDDLFQTGATINEVGRVLKEAHAGTLLGLVGTKTLRDLE
jgi:hypothetical protein